MNSDNKQVLNLLDSATIKALMRLYNVPYKVLAVRFRCTRQNILYLLQNNALKQYQLEQLYEIFKVYGMNDTDLMLVHHMTKKKAGEGK